MNIFNVFLKRKKSPKQNLSKMIEDWKEPIVFAIGGLTEIGFYDKWNYLLVNSYQGRGVFDCSDSTRIARDNSALNNEDINYNQRTIKGIGPLQGKNIHCVGLWGGNLSTSTIDGWSIDIIDTDTVIVSSPDKVSIKFPSPVTELRAVGFSTNGQTFIYATSSEIMFYVRKNHKIKLIMPMLPLLEKSYNSPRSNDDIFMYDVILLACNWSDSGWICNPPEKK